MVSARLADVLTGTNVGRGVGSGCRVGSRVEVGVAVDERRACVGVGLEVDVPVDVDCIAGEGLTASFDGAVETVAETVLLTVSDGFGCGLISGSAEQLKRANAPDNNRGSRTQILTIV